MNKKRLFRLGVFALSFVAFVSYLTFKLWWQYDIFENGFQGLIYSAGNFLDFVVGFLTILTLVLVSYLLFKESSP